MTQAPLFEIRGELIDGIPVFWAESPLRFTAGMVFRVGRVDEELGNSGLSHLIEHLALPPSEGETPFNGTVDATYTSFWAEGERSEVLALLAGVARSVAAPPLERLEHERRILLTEAASSDSGVIAHTAALRFGPVGYGLIGYDELGLHRITRADVADWTRARYTSGNVAVYMSGEPPDSLDYELPAGERQPTPPPEPIPYLEFPSAFPYGISERVAVSMLVRRSEALLMALNVAERRVTERLRARAGMTYTVDWSYKPLTLELAHVVFWADCLDENAETVRNGILTTLDDLAEHGPTAEELGRDAQQTRSYLVDPTWLPNGLHERAEWELMGGEFETDEDHLRARLEVTPPEAAAALAEGLETMLLTVPSGTGLPGGRFTRYPTNSPALVSGRRYRERGRRFRRGAHEKLIAGEDGVARHDGEHRSAVRFDECLGLLVWKDDTRGLYSRDGFYVEVNPARWRGAADLPRLIDARVTAPRIPMDEPESFLDPDLRAGADASERGDHAEAVERLTAGLVREPDDWEAWCWLAYSQRQLDDPLGALASAHRAAALAPDREWPYRLRAYALADIGRFDDAAEAALRAREAEPGELSALEAVCLIATDVGLEDEARAAAARAVELFPDDATAWSARGVVLATFGPRAAAEEAFRKAIELEPEFSTWRSNLAWSILLDGRPADALEPLKRALAIDGANESALYLRGIALRWLGRGQEAERERLARDRAGLARADELVARAPDDPDAHLLRARALLALGRGADAVEAARAAARFGEDAPSVRLEAAEFEANYGDCRRALALLESPAPESLRLLYARAWIGAVCARPDDAAAAADRALELNDNDERAWLAKTYAAVAAGEWEEAVAWSERVLERNGLHCCGHSWRAIAEHELGDDEAARANARRSAAINTVCRCAARRRLEATLDV